MANLTEAKSRVWQSAAYELTPEYEAFPGEKSPMERVKGIVRGVEIDVKVLHCTDRFGNPSHLVSGRVDGSDASLQPHTNRAFELFSGIAPRLRKANRK